MGESGDAGTRTQRITRALTAQTRQQFAPVARGLVERARHLARNAGDLGIADFDEDLDRAVAAAERLSQILGELDRIAAATPGSLGDVIGRLRHDLKNPLNAVRGYAEMVAEEAADLGIDAAAADLKGLIDLANQAIGQIDQALRPTVAPDGDGDGAAPAGRGDAMSLAQMAEALVDSVRSVGEGEDRPETPPATVLVVDDTAANRDLLSRRLTRDGHRAIEAAGGREALERIATEAIDLVLLDLLMPDMNGFQVLSHLKREARFRDVPVIMISALDETDSIIRCIEAGAEDYLTKPFDTTLLRARIGSSLEKKRLREQEQEMIRRDLEMAVLVQRSLLPARTTADAPIDAVNRPYRHVSGDFFDFFERPDGRWCFAIGDVSGKGMDAALLMARVAGLLRFLGKEWTDPGQILAALNDEMVAIETRGRFITAVVGLYDAATGETVFANAGNLPPTWILPDGTWQSFAAAAPPLGVLPGMAYRTEAVRLERGSLALFTDGLIESSRDGGHDDELGLEGSARLLAAHAERPASEQLERLIATLDDQALVCRDDLTVMVVAGPAAHA